MNTQRRSTALGKAEGGGGLLAGQPGEIAELDESGLKGVHSGQPGEGGVEGDEVEVRFRDRDGVVRQLDVDSPTPTVFEALLAPGAVDEDAAHGLGGGGEEVAPAVPAVVVRGADQPEVRLVDQGGGFECLAWGFGRHSRSRELPQLVVHEREQFGGRFAVTGLCCFEKEGYVGHAAVLPGGGTAS